MTGCLKDGSVLTLRVRVNGNCHGRSCPDIAEGATVVVESSNWRDDCLDVCISVVASPDPSQVGLVAVVAASDLRIGGGS